MSASNLSGDVETILSVTNRDVDEIQHTVSDGSDAVFTWDYDKAARPALAKLYEKAKRSQWNATTDLPWETDVDVERLCADLRFSDYRARYLRSLLGVPGSPLRSWGEREWAAYTIEAFNHRLSQFLHGEQGALLCTAKLVEAVPWIDGKYYAATQVMDEARHVEVFARYLDTKLDGHYPINAHLRQLLDDTIRDSRWDMTFLGMQILIEGLALASFGLMYQMYAEPLLRQLLRYVMSDEARHVAFGVLALKEHYGGLSSSEIRERQEFAFEAAIRMRDRFLQQEVWDRLGVEPRRIIPLLLALPAEESAFQKQLFSKIVPNCKKLGLLDAGATADRPGWLRQKFAEIGVIEYENASDTSEDYASFDAISGTGRGA